jgi:ABC-type transport system involved in multi-copper enzyme maturation permease subunit
MAVCAERLMLFSLGPVMRYELITTSRRRRYYFLRAIYGLLLLAQLSLLFSVWESTHPAGGTLKEIQSFAEDAFIQFAGAQGLCLLLLIPALVAGIISDEYQRKTLHYLLASRLSSAEIVLGKLGARLVHVIAFVAVGLPIVALLMLYGGLNPLNIFYVYMGTTTLVLFTSGFSILTSTLARRPRDAILITYGLGVLWLLAPLWIAEISRFLDGPLAWVPPVNDFLILSNPIKVWSNATYRTSRFMGAATRLPFSQFRIGFVWHFAIMAGIQTLAGLLFVGVAVAGLRPLRGSSWPGGKPQTGWFARLAGRYRRFVEARATAALVRNQLLVNRADRPSCGDDPMLWKERFTRMGGGLKWLGSRPVALFFIVFLCCYLFDVAVPAVGGFTHSLWQARSWSTWLEMNAALRTSSAILAALVMLPISAAAAASVTSEREQDTWTSLATTLLTPVEVIRGKQFGSIWSARWLGVGLVAMLGMGLLSGAFHPLGLFAALAVLATSSWLSAAIGVLASTLARNSTRAAFFTFFAMFVFVWASGWPSVFWQSLASYADMRYLWTGEVPTGYARRNFVAPPLLGAAVLSAVDSILAGLLTLWSIKRLATTWGRG